MKFSKLSLLAISVFCMVTVSVNGSAIPLGNSGWSMVVTENLVGGGEVLAPYLYGVGNDEVTIEIDKVFNQMFTGQSYEPVVIQFIKTSADAVSRIIINDENVRNDTDREWFDFHMSLLSPIAPLVGFNPNYIPSGDQLENVSFSNNNGYNGLPTQLNFVDADGHGVLTGLEDTEFLPGYADGQIVIVTSPLMSVGGGFILQESPSVPEPTTVLLLGMGGLAVWRKNRRAVA